MRKHSTKKLTGYLSIGTTEPERCKRGENFHEALEKAGIKHVYMNLPILPTMANLERSLKNMQA